MRRRSQPRLIPIGDQLCSGVYLRAVRQARKPTIIERQPVSRRSIRRIGPTRAPTQSLFCRSTPP